MAGALVSVPHAHTFSKKVKYIVSRRSFDICLMIKLETAKYGGNGNFFKNFSAGKRPISGFFQFSGEKCKKNAIFSVKSFAKVPNDAILYNIARGRIAQLVRAPR